MKIYTTELFVTRMMLKTLMTAPNIISVFVLTILGCLPFYGQAMKTTGIVRISIPSIPYKIPPEDTNKQVYKVFLNGKDSSLRVPYTGRTEETNSSSRFNFYVDHYEIRVPPGEYRLSIQSYRGFRLPNFTVAAGKAISFTVPQSRFDVEEVCMREKIIVKTYNPETSTAEQQKAYREIPYRQIRVDDVSLDKPYDAVIYECGKKVEGNLITFKGARMYYKNHFFSGTKLILDMNDLTVRAVGEDGWPAEIQINGGEVEEKMEFKAKLRSL